MGSNGIYIVSEKSKQPELAKIDRQRRKINREIKKGENNLYAYLQPKNPANEIEFERYFNQQVYGTKLRKPNAETLKKQKAQLTKQIKELKESKEPPKNKIANLEAKLYALERQGEKANPQFVKSTNFEKQNSSIIREAKKLYLKRKPLDKKASQLRKKEDTSTKQIYDTLRLARKSKRHEIYINNEPIKFYGDEKNPYGDIEAVYRQEPIYGKDKDGNKVQTGTKKIFAGYKINKKGLGENPKVVISATKEKEKLKYSETTFIQRGEIEIHEDDKGRLYIAGLSEVWNYAERNYGARIIYINGIPYSPADFEYQRQGGIWYFKPDADVKAGMAHISYKKPVVNTRYELASVKEQIAAKPKEVYFEFDTTVEIVGKMENVHIAFITREAYGKLREAVKSNNEAIKAGGQPIWYILGTKFNISKPLADKEIKRMKELDNKTQLLMTDNEKIELKELKERAGFKILVEISDVLITSDIDKIINEENKDRFIILAEARSIEGGGIAMIATIKESEFEAGGEMQGSYQ